MGRELQSALSRLLNFNSLPMLQPKNGARTFSLPFPVLLNFSSLPMLQRQKWGADFSLPYPVLLNFSSLRSRKHLPMKLRRQKEWTADFSLPLFLQALAAAKKRGADFSLPCPVLLNFSSLPNHARTA